jgi:hypothetical protein
MHALPVIGTFVLLFTQSEGGDQMNASTQTTKTDQLSWATTIGGLARQYLGGRRGLIVLAIILIAAALSLNWGWLAAAGIAPILLALAPCAVMCALGLCMNKMGGKSCSRESDSTDQGSNRKGASIPTATKTSSEA